MVCDPEQDYWRVSPHIGKQYTGAFEERLCAANNRSYGVPAMPIADKPDF
jgi:hypothetical protein